MGFFFVWVYGVVCFFVLVFNLCGAVCCIGLCFFVVLGYLGCVLANFLRLCFFLW